MERDRNALPELVKHSPSSPSQHLIADPRFLSPPPGKPPLLQGVPPSPGVPGLTFCALCSSSLRNSEPFSRISTEELRSRDTLSCSVDWGSCTPPASWLPLPGSSLSPLDGIKGFQCPTEGEFWLSSSKLTWLWRNSTGKMSVGVIQSLPPTLTTHPAPGTGSGNEAWRVMEKNLGSNSCTCSFALHPYGSALLFWQSLLTQDEAEELRTAPPGIPFSPVVQEKHPADGFLGF